MRRLSLGMVLLGLTFLAPAVSAASLRFTATADSRSFYADFAHVLSEINARVGGPGDFHATLGDTDSETGNQAELVNAFGAAVTWFPVVGNHDIENPADIDFLRAYGVALPDIVRPGPDGTSLTAYSFDHGNAHFVVTNQYFDGTSETGTDGDLVDAQYDWLAADLAANTRPAVFVFGHEPAYPLNRHVGDSLDQYPADRDRFWALLEQENVAAFIVGHTHVYSVTQLTAGKTWQIDLGNAGNNTSGDGFTFLDATVSDCVVRFDIWRGDSGPMTLAQSWTHPFTLYPTPTSTPAEAPPTLPSGFSASLWPNPCTDHMPLNLQLDLSSQTPDVSLDLFTTASRRVVSWTMGGVPAGRHVFQIPLRDLAGKALANGVYYAIVRTAQGKRVIKVVVLR